MWRAGYGTRLWPSGEGLGDEVNEFVGHDDDFFGGGAGEEFAHGVVDEDAAGDGVATQAAGQVEVAADFAVDLDDDLDGVVGEPTGVGLGPGVAGEGGGVAEELPEFFGDVRSEWGEDEGEDFGVRAGQGGACGSVFGVVVDPFHEGTEGGVEAEGFDVVGDFFECAVGDFLAVGGRVGDVADVVGEAVVEFVVRVGVNDEAPGAGEEAVDAFDASGAPGFGLLQRAHEHFEAAEGVGAVVADDVVGIDDVAEGFRHFLAVFAKDEALVDEALEGLGGGEVAEVVKDFVPESCVEEVEDGVFGAADVEVHAAGGARGGEPVAFFFRIEKGAVVVGVEVAEVIPAGAGPLGHGVGLAGVAGDFAEPVGGFGEGAAGVAGGAEVVELGLEEGELVFGEGMVLALGVPEDGEGFAPVALAGEEPIAEFVLGAWLAFAVVLEPAGDGFFSLGCGEAVEELGVDGDAVVFEGEGEVVVG